MSYRKNAAPDAEEQLRPSLYERIRTMKAPTFSRKTVIILQTIAMGCVALCLCDLGALWVPTHPIAAADAIIVGAITGTIALLSPIGRWPD